MVLLDLMVELGARLLLVQVEGQLFILDELRLAPCYAQLVSRALPD